MASSTLQYVCQLCQTKISISYEWDDEIADETMGKFAEDVIGILVCPVCEVGSQRLQQPDQLEVH